MSESGRRLASGPKYLALFGSCSQAAGEETAAQFTTAASGPHASKHSGKPSPLARSTCISSSTVYRSVQRPGVTQVEESSSVPYPVRMDVAQELRRCCAVVREGYLRLAEPASWLLDAPIGLGPVQGQSLGAIPGRGTLWPAMARSRTRNWPR